MNTYTDSERLDFLVSQGYDCSAITHNPNYRAVIDRSIDAWNERIGQIANQQVKPSEERVTSTAEIREALKMGRFADKDHPQGFAPTCYQCGITGHFLVDLGMVLCTNCGSVQDHERVRRVS